VERLLTAEELASHLQCSKRTVWRMVKKGLPAHRISDRLVRFDVGVVDGWLKSQGRVRPTQASRSVQANGEIS